MRYTTLPPSPPLADAVEAYWCYEGYRPPHAVDRVLPAGTVEMVVNLTGGAVRCYEPDAMRLTQLRGPVFTGVHRRHLLVETAQQYCMLGVAFRPGGAWRILGCPVDEIAGCHVEMETLFGRRPAERLMEQLHDAKSAPEKIRVIDRELCSRLGRELHPAVAWAAEQIVRYPEAARLAELAEEAGLSTRRFREIFSREIGISPKGFIRIRRFQSLLKRLQAPSRWNGSVLAAEAGYADQAHSIRDFQEFTGLSPSQYRRTFAELQRHVPAAEQDQICPVPTAAIPVFEGSVPAE